MKGRGLLLEPGQGVDARLGSGQRLAQQTRIAGLSGGLRRRRLRRRNGDGDGRHRRGKILARRGTIGGAGQSHRHLRLGAAVGQALLSPLPIRQVQRITERGQLREGPREVPHSVLFAIRRVDGDGGEFLPLEDLSDQSRQAIARAALHEGRDPVAAHGLDGLHELDGVGKLVGQDLPRLRRGIGIHVARGVGVDRQGRLAERQQIEGCREGLERRGDERAVERRGDWKPDHLVAASGQYFFCLIDLAGRARQHILRGRVAVGDDEVQLLFLHGFFDFVERRDHREHGALVGTVALHQAAAQTGQGMECRGVVASRKVQGD